MSSCSESFCWGCVDEGGLKKGLVWLWVEGVDWGLEKEKKFNWDVDVKRLDDGMLLKREGGAVLVVVVEVVVVVVVGALALVLKMEFALKENKDEVGCCCCCSSSSFGIIVGLGKDVLLSLIGGVDGVVDVCVCLGGCSFVSGCCFVITCGCGDFGGLSSVIFTTFIRISLLFVSVLSFSV